MAFAPRSATPPRSPRSHWGNASGTVSPASSRAFREAALLGDDDAAVRAWAASAMPRGATPPRSPRGGSLSPLQSRGAAGGASPAPPSPRTASARSRTPPSATPEGGEAEGAADGEQQQVISVCIRMRGLVDREAADGMAWKVDGRYVWEAEAEAAAEERGGDVTAYEFPAVFGPGATQQQVYAHVRPVVLGFLSGYNGTIFAYGQTSAGKTFTMQGPRDAPGIIPRALADLFAHLNAARNAAASADAAAVAAGAALGGPSFRCRVTLSYCELYNEELIDLLAPEQPAGGLHVRDAERGGVGGGVASVDGIREVPVADVAAAAACLAEGEARRHVAATAMNRASSRSHALLRVTLDMAVADPQAPPNAPDAERMIRRRSALSLVDLAGSERASTRGNAGGSTWQEGCAINMGLLSLGRVVRALAAAGSAGENGAPPPHVPFRDSKLTRLLAGALGGNARAAAVCCATPAAAHAADTRGTLRFAERCMLVAQRATLNESLGARAQLAQAHKEIARLRAQLASLQQSLQAERRRGGGAATGPAEEGLLAALEAEVERLRAAAHAAEEAAASERAQRIEAQRRLAALQAGLPPFSAPGSAGGGLDSLPPSRAGSFRSVTPPLSPRTSATAAAAAAVAATAADAARASSAERNALARQLLAAASAAEAQRAANAAAGGAVNALYRTIAAHDQEVRAVRAEIERAASPLRSSSPLPLPPLAATAASDSAKAFWAAALGDEAAAPAGLADSLSVSPRDAAWRAAAAAAAAPGGPGFGPGSSYYR